MQRLIYILVLFVLFTACKPKQDPEPSNPDPAGTVYFTENTDYFANPERGWLSQKYFESTAMDTKENLRGLQILREGDAHVTLVLESYYMMDYMESEIPQAYIDRMVNNFATLRQAGCKAILRFSYKNQEGTKSQPWDATPEWACRHIKQLAPYLVANSDVILCIQAGYIGIWGEWYYTTNYKQNPKTDDEYRPRFQVVDTLLKYYPQDKQIALRTPTFKLKYLQMAGLSTDPLEAAEAYQNTPRARLAAHDDAWVSSQNDMGTFTSSKERTFWQQDTRYVYFGGESCANVTESSGKNSLLQSENYHLTYLNMNYHGKVLTRWKNEYPEGSKDSYYNQIQRRMGYRFVLEKAYPKQNVKAGDLYTIQLTMRNDGFASLHSPRGVEMILVNVNNAADKHVFPQTDLDPRFWEPGNLAVTLSATLPANLKGTYKVYLNLPDPATTLHDNPLYSIRLANKDVWDETTGYNCLTTIEL